MINWKAEAPEAPSTGNKDFTAKFASQPKAPDINIPKPGFVAPPKAPDINVQAPNFKEQKAPEFNIQAPKFASQPKAPDINLQAPQFASIPKPDFKTHDVKPNFGSFAPGSIVGPSGSVRGGDINVRRDIQSRGGDVNYRGGLDVGGLLGAIGKPGFQPSDLSNILSMISSKPRPNLKGGDSNVNAPINVFGGNTYGHSQYVEQNPVIQQEYSPDLSQVFSPTSHQTYNPHVTSDIKYGDQVFNPHVTSDIKYGDQVFNPSVRSDTKYGDQVFNPRVTSEIKYGDQVYNPNNREDVSSNIRYGDVVNTEDNRREHVTSNIRYGDMIDNRKEHTTSNIRYGDMIDNRKEDVTSTITYGTKDDDTKDDDTTDITSTITYDTGGTPFIDPPPPPPPPISIGPTPPPPTPPPRPPIKDPTDVTSTITYGGTVDTGGTTDDTGGTTDNTKNVVNTGGTKDTTTEDVTSTVTYNTGGTTDKDPITTDKDPITTNPGTYRNTVDNTKKDTTTEDVTSTITYNTGDTADPGKPPEIIPTGPTKAEEDALKLIAAIENRERLEKFRREKYGDEAYASGRRTGTYTAPNPDRPDPFQQVQEMYELEQRARNLRLLGFEADATEDRRLVVNPQTPTTPVINKPGKKEVIDTAIMYDTLGGLIGDPSNDYTPDADSYYDDYF